MTDREEMDYWERHENPREDDVVDLIELARLADEAIARLPLHRRLWWEIRTTAHYTFAVALPVRWAIFRNHWRLK